MSEPTPVPASRSRRFFRGARQVSLTVLARLRFVAILAAIGFVITQWETLTAHYAKWMRPAQSAAADPDSEYYCPMHPTVVRDNNKEKCPICFMPLSKRKKGGPTDEALPAGVVSRVQLSPYRVVLAGARTMAVEYQPLTKEVVTVGTVEFDERGLKQVAARVKGRIDELFANQTGETVRKGQPLAKLYSPDLVVTVQNLLDAKQSGNEYLQKIARDRLKLWGIEDDQIRKVLEDGTPITHLTIRSPIDGHVIKKYQTEGRYVEEGAPLYDVADLHTVWVQAQVYEEDLAFLPRAPDGVPEGDPQPITATTRAFPGEELEGKVSFVYPHVDPDSRTLTVRFELPNPGHRLRPGMTATVRLEVRPERLQAAGGPASKFRLRGGNLLAVPEGSVIDTGRQKVVYREESPGVFDGVLVELGPRMAGPGGVPFFPVLAGLNEGERVVTAGSFLIDAETRLNPAAGSIYIGGSGGGREQPPPTHIRPSTPDDPELKVAAAFAKLAPEDRAAARAQGTCPITGQRLGSMGPPAKVTIRGKPVFTCCDGCNDSVQEKPEQTLRKVEKLKGKSK